MPHQPPYQITQKILSPVAQISETMGQTRMAAAQNSPQVRKQYQSLDDFLNKWNQADKKQAIIEELTEQGIIFEDIKEAVNKEMDIFDMICYTAFDQPPLPEPRG